MVFFKNYFMDPLKRQIFRDAFAQIFSLILRPCPTGMPYSCTLKNAKNHEKLQKPLIMPQITKNAKNIKKGKKLPKM